jgi:membrane protein YqaA with SNARE-associated domain
MNKTEIYSLLFTDTLVANLAFTPSAEVAIYTMKIFNNYNNYLIIIITASAFFIASCINYALGMACYKILAPFNAQERKLSLSRIEQLRNSKYLFLFLALGAVPFFGKFVSFAAGFCRVNVILAIAFISCIKCAYYIYFIMF